METAELRKELITIIEKADNQALEITNVVLDNSRTISMKRSFPKLP